MTDCAHDWAAFLSVVADHDLAVVWPGTGIPDPVLNQIVEQVSDGPEWAVSFYTAAFEGTEMMAMQARRVPITMGDRELH